MRGDYRSGQSEEAARGGDLATFGPSQTCNPVGDRSAGRPLSPAGPPAADSSPVGGRTIAGAARRIAAIDGTDLDRFIDRDSDASVRPSQPGGDRVPGVLAGCGGCEDRPGFSRSQESPNPFEWHYPEEESSADRESARQGCGSCGQGRSCSDESSSEVEQFDPSAAEIAGLTLAFFGLVFACLWAAGWWAR